MLTEQSLRSQVLSYLSRHYSFRLHLPASKYAHFRHQISLKLYPSPLGDPLSQNRYKILIQLTQDLLKRNIVNTQKIRQFGQGFFRTVQQDIMVLRNNQQIRKNFTQVRQQIGYRMEALLGQQGKLEEQCRSIAERQDILTFLQGSFKNYLDDARVVIDNYDAVHNVQVYTTINIDSIYNQKLANQEDYFQHYQPLLEVMERLKSNMLKLYDQLNSCQYYQLPLKSVNFLANCKNLLNQLQPFLIRPDCVFNRLIFYVARSQQQNNKFINKTFKLNLGFTNDMVSDIFKSFHLQYIFQDYFGNYHDRLRKQKQQLISAFQNKMVNYQNFSGTLNRCQRNVGDWNGQLQNMRMIVGTGKDRIMRQYLGSKQCIKNKQIDEMVGSNNRIRSLAKKMMELLKYNSKVQHLQEKLSDTQNSVKKTLLQIFQAKENALNQYPSTVTPKMHQQQLQQRLKRSFLMIQEGLVSLAYLEHALSQSRSQETQQYFETNYYPKQKTVLDDIYQKYTQLQTSMLNGYQKLRQQKSQRFQQAKKQLNSLLEQMNDYLDQKISVQIGFQITNQDQQCQFVKDQIVKVQKVQFMIQNYGQEGGKKEEMEKLGFYKSNLEWLLQVFQGSMDQKIFQSFLGKLNFEINDWKTQVSKVKQLTKQLNRYTNLLKGIVRSGVQKVHPKVLKLVKNRIQLYQIIQDMYQQFVVVYENSKSNNQLNISDHGLKIFDEATYKYVLMLYQYRNRLKAQSEQLRDLLLPRKTLNYLLDQIYQPFVSYFSDYIGYSQQQLLTFTRLLQQALNFKASQVPTIKLLQTTLSKPYSKDLFPSILKLASQIVEQDQKNKKVLELENQEVVIYNLNQYRKLLESMKEYVSFCKLLAREIENEDLRLDVQLQNETLRKLRTKLLKDWQMYSLELNRSIGRSSSRPLSQRQ